MANQLPNYSVKTYGPQPSIGGLSRAEQRVARVSRLH
jgi:hypothetical protein